MTFAETIQSRPGLRRGAATLPSAFTIGNLFFGFSAVVAALRLEFSLAGGLIVVAGILDLLDGRIARLTGNTSEFGAELDSLSDLVSFGVAPAVIAYQWGLVPQHQPFLAAFAFVLAAAIRLARFNVLRKEGDGRHFAGLPSPAAAGLVVSVVVLHPSPPVGGIGLGLTSMVLVLAALLMVSPIPYWSFKKIELKLPPSQCWMVGVVALAVVVLQPTWALLACAWAYAASGPTRYLLHRPEGVPIGTGAAELDPRGPP